MEGVATASTRAPTDRAPRAACDDDETEMVRRIHRKVGGPARLSTLDDPAAVRAVVIAALAADAGDPAAARRVAAGDLSALERRVVRTVTNRGAAVRSRMRQRRELARLRAELRDRDARLARVEAALDALTASVARARAAGLPLPPAPTHLLRMTRGQDSPTISHPLPPARHSPIRQPPPHPPPHHALVVAARARMNSQRLSPAFDTPQQTELSDHSPPHSPHAGALYALAAHSAGLSTHGSPYGRMPTHSAALLPAHSTALLPAHSAALLAHSTAAFTQRELLQAASLPLAAHRAVGPRMSAAVVSSMLSAGALDPPTADSDSFACLLDQVIAPSHRHE